MKRLLVSLDEERYEDLRRLAFDKKASMSDLVRYAVEKVFEDDLDAMAGQRGLEDYLKNAGEYVSLDQALEELGIELPDRRPRKGRSRAQEAAS